MKLHGPVGQTPLDEHLGLVGQPMDRVDGRLKVTGAARYAYEWPHDAPLYGFVVQSTIGHGRIKAIDTAAAERAPGVKLVLTHLNAPPQTIDEHRKAAPQLTGPEIHNFGQPIALVVAETFEQARDAAFLVRTAYNLEQVSANLRSAAGQAVVPQPSNDEKPDSAVGAFDSAFASAPVKLDVNYTTPMQNQAAMEPHATIARWDGDLLILENANQMVSQSQEVVARTLQMPKEKVRLISKYVGGGFGSKLWVNADCILAAIAAKQTGRTVKVALTRMQVFSVTTHRSDTIQRLRLGADKDGTLLAIGHDVLSGNREGEPGFESAAMQTRTLYAGANRLTRHRLAAQTVPVASSMRAPGEAVGLLALECAMDELAERLGLDPIELRMRNEPEMDPEKRIPFSSRNLIPCLQEGAKRFGWNRRRKPGERTDGRWLVGMGVAAATRNNPLKASKARVRLDPDGVVVVQMAMTDIGTGTYTILTQIAASLLGVQADRVRVELGDSDLPMAAGSGGSFGASSSGAALLDACMTMRAQIARAAGMEVGEAVFADGMISAGGVSKSIAALAPAGGLVVEGEIEPGDNAKQYSQQSYGAHFAEVGVDQDSGEIRLRRMLGVFTAGRILNAKTARSQAIGGMIFGVGAALTEDLVMDSRFGNFVNQNLAEYHVPVHADVPMIDAVFLPELDQEANPLKSKGVGELGICGAGAAVANAVYNATGVRIRDYPLTLDKVLVALPAGVALPKSPRTEYGRSNNRWEPSTMSISRRGLALGAAAMPLFAIRSRAAAPEFSYKMANNTPVTHPLTVQMQAAADRVLRGTDGRVEIRIFPNSQLGSDTDMLSQVRSGAIEFFTLSGLILSTLVPAASINGVGFAFKTYDQVWSAMDGKLGTYVRGEIGKRGLYAFERPFDNGFRQTTSSNKPIRTAEDLKGFKIRVPVSPLWTSMFQGLGASPASINFAEVYSALQTHIVDGQENPLSLIETAKLYEVQKYCAMTNHMWDGFWLLGNRRAFDKLPADAQSVVQKELSAAAVAEREDIAKLNIDVKGTLEKRGLVFNEVDTASFRDALKQAGFYRDWRAKYGEDAWHVLEEAVGAVS